MKLNEPFLFLKHNNGICDLLCTDDFNLLGGLNVTVRAFSRFFALFARLSVVRYSYINSAQKNSVRKAGLTMYLCVWTCELLLFFFSFFLQFLFSSPKFYCLDFFVSFVLRHSWVLKVLTPRMSRIYGSSWLETQENFRCPS